MTRDPRLSATIARVIAEADMFDAQRRADTRAIHAAQKAMRDATHALMAAEGRE